LVARATLPTRRATGPPPDPDTPKGKQAPRILAPATHTHPFSSRRTECGGRKPVEEAGESRRLHLGRARRQHRRRHAGTLGRRDPEDGLGVLLGREDPDPDAARRPRARDVVRGVPDHDALRRRDAQPLARRPHRKRVGLARPVLHADAHLGLRSQGGSALRHARAHTRPVLKTATVAST
jgi:hypothetical protein